MHALPSKLGQQQATATEATNDTIAQLLNLVATCPANGITYRTSNMVLSAHSDAAFLNVSKACCRPYHVVQGRSSSQLQLVSPDRCTDHQMRHVIYS